MQENSVPPKHNDCGDVTHDVFMHEIADILAYKLPYSVEHEKGLKGQSVWFNVTRQKVKFEKGSKNKRKTKRRKYARWLGIYWLAGISHVMVLFIEPWNVFIWGGLLLMPCMSLAFLI